VGEHGTARRNLLQVSTGNVVFLRQTNTGTKPFRVSYDISPSARWQTLEQNPNDGSITGAHSARSVVGTETCSKSNSLSGGWCDTLTEKNQGDTTYCELSKQSSSQTPFRWKHKYPPITKPITKVTLTIDCKDCDSGTIGLRSILDTGGSGIVLGTITGATNGNAGSDSIGMAWECQDSNSENTLVLPKSLFDDVKDGEFEIEMYTQSNVNLWGSNRAILEISTDVEYVTKTGTATSSDSNTMKWVSSTSTSLTFPVATPLMYEVKRTSSEITGSTYKVESNIIVNDGAVLITPPNLEISGGHTFTLNGRLSGAENILITGSSSAMTLGTTASAAAGDLDASKVGYFYWQTLHIEDGGKLSTADSIQTIVARTVGIGTDGATGYTSKLMVYHTVYIRSHQVIVGSEGEINGQGHGYEHRNGPGTSIVNGNGASHGGVGFGQPWTVGDGKGGYGSTRKPTTRGSGGYPASSNGGAAVIVESVDEMSFIVDYIKTNLTGSLKSDLSFNDSRWTKVGGFCTTGTHQGIRATTTTPSFSGIDFLATIICSAAKKAVSIVVMPRARGNGLMVGDTVEIFASDLGGTNGGNITLTLLASDFTNPVVEMQDTIVERLSRGLGSIQMDGLINVKGNSYGAGGSVQLRASGFFTGSGTVVADGGTNGGGGGRISLHCDCIKNHYVSSTSYGGWSAGVTKGGAGTIYSNFTNFPNAITVDNNGDTRNIPTYTPPHYYEDTTVTSIRDSVPTTLLYAQADDSVDFVAFNQTSIHTLNIFGAAHVVLAAPGLEPGSLTDPAVASVTSVQYFRGDGTGMLRVVDGSTMIVHEKAADYEHGQQIEVEVVDDADGTGIVQLVGRSGKTMGNTFHLQVHLTIESKGRLITPKTVVVGSINSPMTHRWAGTWSGVENLIFDNSQTVWVAPTAGTEPGLNGHIKLNG
jgi:hypothetical protein